MPGKPRAEYEIRAKDESAAGWRSALATADKNAQRLSATLGSAFAGVLSVSAFTAVAKSAISFGDEIGKLSVKIGANAKVTSELVAVAKQFDIEAEGLATSLKKMQIAVSQGASGNKEMLENFRALGLDVQELRALAPDKQFERIGDAISKLRDPTDRARAAVALFGKAGADLLPLFEKGAEGIRKAREEARQFGTVLSDLDVQKLQDADDSIKRLEASTNGLGVTATSAFAPFISGAIDAARRLLGGATELEKLENQLRILQETDNSIPIFFNFGFLDQGGVVLGPEEIKKAMEQLEQRILRLKEASGALGRNAGPGRRFQRGVVSRDEPPGFRKTVAAVQEDPFTPELRRNIAMWDRWRRLVDETDQGIANGIVKSNEAIEDSFDDLPEPIMKTTDAMSVFGEQAARNMQDAFADFLFDPFADGLDGMLKGFIDIIRRMLAEAASAKLLEALGGTQGFGNFLGSLFGSSAGASSGGDALSQMFALYGGPKAGGGPLTPGKWHIAGEYGPEPVWGGGPGAFAMGYGGGGNAINLVINNDNRGASMDLIRALPEHDRRLAEQIESRIVTKLRRRQYNLG